MAQTPLYPPPPSKQRLQVSLTLRLVIVMGLLLVLMTLGVIVYVSVAPRGFPFGRAAQTQITTASLQTVVTYAGLTVTVQEAQLAGNFADDQVTNAAQVVRIRLQIANTTAIPINFLPMNVMQLVLPQAKTVSPTYIQGRLGIPAGSTQTSVVDFPLSSPVRLSQLVLRLGARNEVQMTIPLAAHADLSQYAPKTKQINVPLQYYGLNWTIESVTSQMSLPGEQAPNTMRYIVIQMSVDNTLSQVAIPGSAYDYMRLNYGKTGVAPIQTTLPVAFATGSVGQTGTVTFLVPQKVSSVTLTLAAQQQNGFDSAVTNVQLP